MINVDFTTNSGETIYSYSWQNCGGNKNVNFELENPSYTWCTVTHTPENSKVKIHADAVPERQRDPRSAKVLMKVNDVTCDEYFYVSQPGQPCHCSAFIPIEIGATFPSSGAAVGTVIGSYYNDTTCDASKITITGDLQAEAVGGQIKLTSAVGAYNDGRTFNVIFNYDGSECTRGTCTQSAASCRCTTITATPYTFAAPDTCGDIRPVTVLTIDGCCSIVTGITGTDSDKFTITTATSGDYKVVKACPSSTNISTSTDRRATVSVTATCGNDTCSSSTTLTQEHSGCTPSECTCYTVSNASVVDGSNLTCESTSATVRWNFTGYTITKNADCTTAKTQVVQSYQDGTVNFLPNTGGETSVTRSGETEWYNHLACIGNTCGQSNVKVPWTVELPACSSCDCNCWYLLGFERFIEYLPASGVTSSQLVAKYYHSLEKFTPSCYNSIGLGNPYVIYPSGQAVSINSHVTAYTGTYNGQPATVLELWVDNLDANPETNKIRIIDYPFNIGGNYCISFTLQQEGAEIQCTCEYFVESGLIRPIKTKIPNAGTSGQLVEIASGNTHGCGTLVGYINATTMIDSFSAHTIEKTERIDGKDVVVDTDYHWWASFTENDSQGGVLRTCALSFLYYDNDNVLQPCNQDIIIMQNQNICTCPSIISIDSTYDIDGKEHGIGIPETAYTRRATLSTSDGYMCQFVLAESDSSWCTAYTSFERDEYGSSDSGDLYIEIKTTPNFSTQTRTARITYFGISSPQNGSGNLVIRPYERYTKSDVDAICTYETCKNAGTVTVNQAPFGPCNCTTSEFEVYSSARTVNYDDTSWTFTFSKNICGEATYTYQFVDENGNSIQMSDTFVTGVTFNTTSYSDRIELTLEFDYNGTSDQDTTAREVYVVVVMTLHDDVYGEIYVCENRVILTQNGTCTCDRMIVANGYISVGDSMHDDYEVKLAVVGKCGIIDSSDISFSFDQYYDWISLNGLYERDGYIWGSFNISRNTGGYSRSASFTVSVYGTDCSKQCTVEQDPSACLNCAKLMRKIMQTTSLQFTCCETGSSTKTTIARLPYDCSDVSQLSYSINGGGWLSAGNDTDGSVWVMIDNENSSTSERYDDVRITPLDSNGQQVISDCYVNCRVYQSGTNPPTCNCMSVTDDDSNLHITADEWSLVENVYVIQVHREHLGTTIQIGTIQLDEELPSCLEYIVTNTQESYAKLWLRKEAPKNYTIFADFGSNACNSVTSAIIRVDNSTSSIKECWNQIIKFKFPDAC